MTKEERLKKENAEKTKKYIDQVLNSVKELLDSEQPQLHELDKPYFIGWAIATGNITLEPIILFLIIFMWTPSHFWALSLYKTDDYKSAKIPMLPVISGVKITKINIFIYAVLLFPIILTPFILNYFGIFYFSISGTLSIYYIYICYKLLITLKSRTEKKIAKHIFTFSILFLFVIFTSILIDSLI